MATRRNRRVNRKIKRRTRYRQRGGYDKEFEYKRTITFRDPADSQLFDLNFERFIRDAEPFFSPENPMNPINSGTTEDIVAKIRDITVQYADYLALQPDVYVTPGDILYYNPMYLSSVSHPIGPYPFGHIETITGTLTPQNETSIIHTHPNMISGLGSFSIYATAIDTTVSDNTVHLLRYIGKNNNLIRATSAFLCKLFINNKLIDYDTYFTKIISKVVHGSTCRENRSEELIRRVNKTKEKLRSHEKLATVCSGFSILMCELAFIIHGMDDELFSSMPMDAKACTPTQFYNIIKGLPTYWEIASFYKKKVPYTAKSEVYNLFHTKVDWAPPS